jgi:DNA-binding NarL/FixJ family response regulator
MIRVLVVDDYPSVRKSIQTLLTKIPDIESVGEAADGREAVEKAVALKPDVIVMDISMPHLDGIQATGRLLPQIKRNGTKVLLISMYRDPVLIRQGFDKGASGYLFKANLFASLELAIRAIHRGEIYEDSEPN